QISREGRSASLSLLGDEQLRAIRGDVHRVGVIEPGEVALLRIAGSRSHQGTDLGVMSHQDTALAGDVVELEVSRDASDEPRAPGAVHRVERRMLPLFLRSEPDLATIRRPARAPHGAAPARGEGPPLSA